MNLISGACKPHMSNNLHTVWLANKIHCIVMAKVISDISVSMLGISKILIYEIHKRIIIIKM